LLIRWSLGLEPVSWISVNAHVHRMRANKLSLWMRSLFSFPNPVNDKAGRTVAFVVLLEAILTLVTGWYWVTVPLAYGFWARLLTGPTLSPLGWTAQNIIAPRFLGEKHYVAGPPKRFAQAIGAVLATGALVFGLILGDHGVADGFLVLFIPAAGLESLAGYCLGCRAFAILMRLGLIPEEVCADCADISGRLGIARDPAVPAA
jgi:hypothetical protein